MHGQEPVGKKLCTASRVTYCTHTSLMSPTFFMSTSSVKLFYGFILLSLYLIAVVQEGLKQSRISVSTKPYKYPIVSTCANVKTFRS